MVRIRSFRELEVYREAFRLALRIFRITRGFPDDERFGLTSQAVRSSRSVCAETRVHLDIALACGYIDAPLHRDLDDRYDRLIGKLVRMAANPGQWAVGRPAPTSPTSRERGRRKPRGRLPTPRSSPMSAESKGPRTAGDERRP